MNRRPLAALLAAAALLVGAVTGHAIANESTSPIDELRYVEVDAGASYWSITRDLALSCSHTELWQANGRSPLDPGTILLVPPRCLDAPPPTTTEPPVTLPPTTTSPAPTTTAPATSTTVPTGDDYALDVSTEHGPDTLVIPAGFPNPDNTGPRIPVSEMVDVGGSLSSTHDGQIIEGVIVTGRLKIRHDNVVVRDCIVRGTTTYAVDLRPNNGDPIEGSRVEYCEINGALMSEADIPVFGNGGSWTIHRNRIVEVGRSSRGDSAESTWTENFIHTNRTGSSGSHRGGIGNNGGRNMTVVGNTVVVESASGASGAVLLYGDIAPGAIGHRVVGNLVAANSAYLTYGGSVSSDDFPDGESIEFHDNRYSTVFHPDGGRSGFMTSWDGGVRGNRASGNVIHETGELLSFNTE